MEPRPDRLQAGEQTEQKLRHEQHHCDTEIMNRQFLWPPLKSDKAIKRSYASRRRWIADPAAATLID